VRGPFFLDWYVMPATISGSTETFSITDGGLGDDDLAANGTIVDQGDPGTPGTTLRQVPTLDEWGRALLLLPMLATGMAALRRHRAR
jgi:trimeric autotransporter adhesin